MVVGLQSIAVMNGGSETWLDGRRSRWLVGWLVGVSFVVVSVFVFVVIEGERRERGGGKREKERRIGR